MNYEREEGRQEGRHDTQHEIAANMLQSGFKLEDVAKCTNLSLNDIKVLQKKLSH